MIKVAMRVVSQHCFCSYSIWMSQSFFVRDSLPVSAEASFFVSDIFVIVVTVLVIILTEL